MSTRAPARPVAADRRRVAHSWGLVLSLQVVLACVTGLYALGRKSLWFDEGFTFAAAHRSFGSLTDLVVHQESNMAPYDYALHVWMRLADWLHLGRSESTLRLLSVVFFVAAVPLLATLVDRTFGRRPAVLAGFLLALNPFAVLYAQELRAYSMVMCLVVASTTLFVECVLRPRRSVAVAFVLVSVVSFGAHYFAMLVFAAQLVSLLWVPSPRAVFRRLLPTFAALAVVSLPLVLFIVAHRNTTQIDWVPPLTFEAFTDVGRRFVDGDGGSPWPVLVVVGLLAVAAWSTLRRGARGVRTADQWGRILLWCWLAVPVALIVVACLAQNVWVPRYLIVVLPPFVALTAVGVTAIRWRAVQTAAAVLVVAAFAVATVNYYPGQARFGENWRGAARYLASPDVRDHAVVFNPGYLRLGSTYYPWAEDLPAVRNAGVNREGAQSVTASPAETVARLKASPDGVAYVVRRNDDGDPKIDALLTTAGYRQVGVERFGSITVARFARSRTQ